MDLKTILIKCGWHEQEILNSKICGCFNCLSIFEPNKIEEWLDEDPKGPRGSGRTALCPKCGTDSVLPDKIGIEINKEFLEIMRREYF